VYVIVFCVVNVCMLPQPGKNGYADWYEFKSKINQSINSYKWSTSDLYTRVLSTSRL